MSGSVLECAGSNFRMLKDEPNILKILTFFHASLRFRLSSSSIVVVQKSMFRFFARVIEQDTCNEMEKALRVPRAVNIG